MRIRLCSGYIAQKTKQTKPMRNNQNPNFSTELVDTNIRQSCEADFQVEIVPLFQADGLPTGLKATRRTDLGKVFASVGNQYAVVQNSELMNKAEPQFIQKLGDFNKKVYLVDEGQRTYIRYDFKNYGFTNKKVGDHQIRFELRNSFDGSTKVSLALSLLRVVCSNGMTITEDGFNLQQKHNQLVSIDKIGDSIDLAIELFAKKHEQIIQAGETAISQLEGHKILNGLVTRKLVAERVANEIRELWDKPTYAEDADRNLYNLQNAITQHLTHGMELGRNKFELANRLSARLNATIFAEMTRGNLDSLMVESLN